MNCEAYLLPMGGILVDRTPPEFITMVHQIDGGTCHMIHGMHDDKRGYKAAPGTVDIRSNRVVIFHADYIKKLLSAYFQFVLADLERNMEQNADGGIELVADQDHPIVGQRLLAQKGMKVITPEKLARPETAQHGAHGNELA